MNKGIFGFPNSENISTVERFIFRESGTWTVPRAVNSITFHLIGGGGGAGSGASNVSGGRAAGGGGGGGSLFMIQKIWGFDAPPGTQFEIVVGAGGAGGAAVLHSGGVGRNGNPGSMGGTTRVYLTGNTYSYTGSGTIQNVHPGPRPYFNIEAPGARAGLAGGTAAVGSRGNSNPRRGMIYAIPTIESDRPDTAIDGSFVAASDIPYYTSQHSGGGGGGGVSGATQGAGSSVILQSTGVLQPYQFRSGDFYNPTNQDLASGATFILSAGGSATHGNFNAVSYAPPQEFMPIVWATANIGGGGGGGRSGGNAGVGANGQYGAGGGGGGGAVEGWSGTGGNGGQGLVVIYIE